MGKWLDLWVLIPRQPAEPAKANPEYPPARPPQKKQTLRHGGARSVLDWGMKTFLVPVDFSAVSEAIIDTAVTFAQAFGGKVILLHIIAPPLLTSEYALPVETMQETLLAGEKSAQNRLEEYADTFRRAELGVETLVRHGSPVAMILEEATRVLADFIIIGSHGHSRIYDLLVGSTANGVLKGASCGVVIMPPKDKQG